MINYWEQSSGIYGLCVFWILLKWTEGCSVTFSFLIKGTRNSIYLLMTFCHIFAESILMNPFSPPSKLKSFHLFKHTIISWLIRTDYPELSYICNSTQLNIDLFPTSEKHSCVCIFNRIMISNQFCVVLSRFLLLNDSTLLNLKIFKYLNYWRLSPPSGFFLSCKRLSILNADHAQIACLSMSRIQFPNIDKLLQYKIKIK